MDDVTFAATPDLGSSITLVDAALDLAAIGAAQHIAVHGLAGRVDLHAVSSEMGRRGPETLGRALLEAAVAVRRGMPDVAAELFRARCTMLGVEVVQAIVSRHTEATTTMDDAPVAP